MTRAFLSYTKADSAVAVRVAESLRAAGLTVFFWEDPENRGQRFVRQLRREIEGADVFVVLLSPESLASRWCEREWDMAVHRETQLERQFVYVFEVTPTDRPRTGYLQDYDWIDLKAPVDEPKLRAATRVLPRDRPAADPAGNGTPRSVFRNRDDELRRVRQALATTGTEDFWLVVAPPRMGKSWFLRHLIWELDEAWHAKLVDLRDHSLDHRTDWSKLLCQLLDVTEPASGSFTREDRFRVAATVSNRSRRQLYLLDSAELLEQPAARNLRNELTEIYKLVAESGNDSTRMSVVVGSRRGDEWQGYRSSGGSSVRFELVSLTQFTVTVVRQALQEFNRSFGTERLNRWADGLHQLSEGLPALLVEGLRWAEDTAFTQLYQCESGDPDVFDTVARPYIREDLLTVDSLLPFGGERLTARKAALEQALRAIVPYRIFTQSHVRYHIEHDPELAAALDRAGWNEAELWKAMSRTALLVVPSNELWQVFNPPIRRLLYRYFYPAADTRRQVHIAALEYYAKWSAMPAGVEQGMLLQECLWHEATKLALEQQDEFPRKLLAKTVELSKAFSRPERFEPAEFGEYVARKLRNDDEFASLLRHHDGLFEEVVLTIGETISGGG
ncbi:toll/interleukin-1 receptor domain-containing protein [Amycolatopsis sp. cmx-4-68]|uniref:toll/interleukin-1 receptor domain-containing protein n=1 Tax=Amycolatopsis sp. cmx-4-68 TaxID=2790938 RepID=UPI00397A0D42